MSWVPREVEPNGEDPLKQLRELKERYGRKAGRNLIVGVVVLLTFIGLVTSYTQVEPDEMGIVLRLGRYTGELEPGPHFTLPYGIDRVRLVPVQPRQG